MSITVDNKVNDKTIDFRNMEVGATFLCRDKIYIKLNAKIEGNTLQLNELCEIISFGLDVNVIEVDLLVSAIRKPKED